MKTIMCMVTIVAIALLFLTHSYAGCVYHNIYENASVNEDVHYISYDQFVELRNSGESFVLLDVLGEESYTQGYIEGAIHFPVGSITEESARETLLKDQHIVVYCGSFKCQASTMAAHRLGELGYTVVDYKGGLKEWQEKGNKLVS